MHNQPIDRDNDLEQRLTRALDALPEVHIPADFAARVASRVPARRPLSVKPTHYGDYALFLGLLVTLAAMFLLGRATAGNTLVLVESILLAQFILLTLWISLRRHSLR